MEQELLKRIEDLEARLNAMSDYSTLPYELEIALMARGFLSNRDTGVLNGVLIGNKSAPMTAKLGDTGSFYVATVAAGSPATQIVVENGVITNIP